jgi:hypothetical protein
MNRRISTVLAVTLVAAHAGCSDSETGATGGSGGGGGTSTTGQSTSGATTSSGTTTSTSGSTTSSGQGGADAVAAPILTSVEPLTGGLHVMWDNVTTDCDAIELDRKKDDGAYALAYTLTGAAYEQHDEAATAPGTYCYKLRCIRAEEVSPDSNEACGTP